ncbi:MAG: hypothetical protein AAGF46_13325 [Pseudomonadota bacterium]
MKKFSLCAAAIAIFAGPALAQNVTDFSLREDVVIRTAKLDADSDAGVTNVLIEVQNKSPRVISQIALECTGLLDGQLAGGGGGSAIAVPPESTVAVTAMIFAVVDHAACRTTAIVD